MNQMTTLSQTFRTISIVTPAVIFIEMGKVFYKFIWNYESTRITKLFLIKEIEQ